MILLINPPIVKPSEPPPGLARLYGALNSAGVVVVPASPAKSMEPDESDLLAEAKPDEEILDPASLYQDLIHDDGYRQALETDDVVGLYLKEAGRVPLLTADEEVALAKRMEAGQFAAEQLEEMTDYLTADERMELEALVADADAAQEYLVRANSRLVISVAKKYIGRGVHFLDLIQEGNIGLMKAVDKFEYRRGYKFSTCLLYTSDAADDLLCVDLGGRRIIKKKQNGPTSAETERTTTIRITRLHIDAYITAAINTQAS